MRIRVTEVPMTRNEIAKSLLIAAADMIGTKVEILPTGMWTTPGSSHYRDDEGEVQLGKLGTATFVMKTNGGFQVTHVGLDHLFDKYEVVVHEPTRRRATAKPVLETIGLNPEQIATIKALQAKMESESRVTADQLRRLEQEQATKAKVAAVKERYGALRNEDLLMGSPRFPKDTPLVRLIESQPDAEELLSQLRDAFNLPGLDTYKVIRAARNAMAEYAMSDGANWRPDSISDVAKKIGVKSFVATLVAHARGN